MVEKVADRRGGGWLMPWLSPPSKKCFTASLVLFGVSPFIAVCVNVVAGYVTLALGYLVLLSGILRRKW